MHVMSPAYVVTLVVTVGAAGGLTVAARRRGGSWIVVANRAIAVVLVATTAAWLWTNGVSQPWHASTSLPLALTDMATLVAAAALWTTNQSLVELTYFWGLAGELQSLLTPDIQVGFPSLEFVEYVVAHAAIVVAAVFLVVGQRRRPRPGSVPRVFAITALYTAFVGLVDWITGGDYMYLAAKPASVTLLSALGPWPWYVVSAAGVAVVLLTVLDAPFWAARRRRGGETPGRRRLGEAPGRRRRGDSLLLELAAVEPRGGSPLRPGPADPAAEHRLEGFRVAKRHAHVADHDQANGEGEPVVDEGGPRTPRQGEGVVPAKDQPGAEHHQAGAGHKGGVQLLAGVELTEPQLPGARLALPAGTQQSPHPLAVGSRPAVEAAQVLAQPATPGAAEGHHERHR
jgi:hypothetical integral membrane protein (TIGR02206 family)